MQKEQSKASSQHSAVAMQVTDDLTVSVIPNNDFEFVMSVRDVSTGYGVSEGNIRNQMFRNQQEIKEGVHYVKGVCFSNTLFKAQPHQVFWTKQGVIRLGFFIKSERAAKFRDWAESVILRELQAPKIELPSAEKRNHRRITPTQMTDILFDVACIGNNKLRNSLLEKLKQL
jgi:hypothetical protein